MKVSSTISKADIVYLASGEKFPDALSSASIAGRHGSPLLLTPRDVVPEGVLAELVRLHPITIVVVGGPASVSDGAMEQISQRVAGSTVVRIGGADRYEVSQSLLNDPTVGALRASTVFGVTGATFPDALTASPAAVHTGLSPVLLIDGSKNAATTEYSVFDGLGADSVHLVGGVNSLSAALQASLTERYTVTRSAGADRYEAGVTVNRDAFQSAVTVYLASGVSFPDALSGAPLAAVKGSPLYVVHPDCVPTSVLDDIARVQAQKIVILGGPATLGAGIDALTPC